MELQVTLDLLANKTKIINETDLPKCKENTLRIDFLNDEMETKPVYGGKEPILPFDRSEVFYAPVQSWRRLTAESNECKAVYEVNFDIKDGNFEFKAGDTIAIIPQNKDSEVNTVLDHLNLQSKADVIYTLNTTGSTKIPAHIPIRSTLRHILTHCLDLRSIVKKLFIVDLYKYTSNEEEKKVLAHLCCKNGSECYNQFILNLNICVLDLFTIFKSCKPPIEVLLNHLTRLLPRPYSIVNSGVNESKVIKICFSVMDIGLNRQGLVTGWLEDKILKETSLNEVMKRLTITDNDDDKIPLYLRSNVSGFSLPQSIDTPLILIGPGTGVAPFIAFLEERDITSCNSDKKGDIWLFCGCRDPELDFIYEKELRYYIDRGVLTKLSTAFSRIQGNEIKYVQDAILAEGEDVVKLIQNGASVFVCGDVKTMASEVREVFVQCISKYQGISKEDAEIFVNDMEKQKKYVVDIWS